MMERFRESSWCESAFDEFVGGDRVFTLKANVNARVRVPKQKSLFKFGNATDRVDIAIIQGDPLRANVWRTQGEIVTHWRDPILNPLFKLVHS